MFNGSSSPVKASNFNPHYPDLLTLYRRPSRCTPAQHTTCGVRDHPRPFFNRLMNLSRSPRPLRAGPTNPAVFQTNIRSPQSRPAHCRSVHFSRARDSGGSWISGMKGLKATFTQDSRPMPTNVYGLVGYDRIKKLPALIEERIYPRPTLAVSVLNL